MLDWKVRQKIYHSLYNYEDIGDSLLKEKIIEEWAPADILRRAIEYINIHAETLYYAGKSYSVAITYALLLEKHFGGDARSYLNDPDLLFGNDPYFKPYSQVQNIYDDILNKFPKFPDDAIEFPEKHSPDYVKTVNYFYKEFLLHPETKIYAPA